MSDKSHLDTMTREELEKYCAELLRRRAELTAKLDWLMEQFRLNGRDIPVAPWCRSDGPRRGQPTDVEVGRWLGGSSDRRSRRDEKGRS